MKKIDSFKIKMILYVLLNMAFIMITSFFLSLVKKPYVLCALIIWSIVITILGVFIIFLVILADKRYLLKYFFLNKDVKKQINEFFEKNAYFSEKEKLQLIKSMKDEYRKYGKISFACYKKRCSVSSLWHMNMNDLYWLKDYGELTEKEKLELVIDGLSNGIRSFLYDYSCFQINYDNFYNIIDNCSNLEIECKKYLLSKKFKKIFEFYENISIKTKEEIQDFDQENNNFFLEFDKFEENIYQIKEDIAVKNYIEYKKFEYLPEDVVDFFLSKDGKERVFVFYDESLNVYRVAHETFIFYYYDIPFMDNEGGWNSCPESCNSLFATQELALNDIKDRIKEFEKISVDKIKK